MSDKLPHVTQSTYTYNQSVFIECVLMTVARQPQSKLRPVCVGDATARPAAVCSFASMCVHMRAHVCTSMFVSACVCACVRMQQYVCIAHNICNHLRVCICISMQVSANVWLHIRACDCVYSTLNIWMILDNNDEKDLRKSYNF